MAQMLARVEIRLQGDLAFPAGSMYWLKPSMVAIIKAMMLRPEEFEVEAAQLDGTLAHAFERCLGFLVAAGGMRVVETGEIPGAPGSRPRPRDADARLRQRLLPAAVPPDARERRLVGQGLHRMDRRHPGAARLRRPRPALPAVGPRLLRPARPRDDGRAVGPRERGRHRRLLRLPLLVRRRVRGRPAHPREAARRPPRPAGHPLPLLSLLGQRGLAAQLGRALGRGPPRPDLCGGLRGRRSSPRRCPTSPTRATSGPTAGVRASSSIARPTSPTRRPRSRGCAPPGPPPATRRSSSAPCSSTSRARARSRPTSSTSGSRCRRTASSARRTISPAARTGRRPSSASPTTSRG